jgi:hypothetical protein
MNALASLTMQAQPMRLRINEQLRPGPVPSSALARVLIEGIEMTNLHLGQVAQLGFIEEIPERTNGRERWRRSAHAVLQFPPRKAQTAEMRTLIDEVDRINFAADLDGLLLSRYQRQEGQVPAGVRAVLTRLMAFPAPRPLIAAECAL